MTKAPPFDLHQRLGYKLALAARANDQYLDNLLSELGITRQMWCVLVAVGEQAISQPSEVAHYIGIDRTAVSRTLRNMEQQGLLRRLSGGRDKRHTEVQLTAKGRRILDRSLPLAEQSARHLATPLSDREQQQLATLLDKFLAGQSTRPRRI